MKSLWKTWKVENKKKMRQNKYDPIPGDLTRYLQS